MKTGLLILLVLHGLIHLMGFTKAFGFAEMKQLTQYISRPAGVLWLAACLLFIIAAYLLWRKADMWWVVAIAAVVISQVVIVMDWKDARFGTIANVIIVAGIIMGAGVVGFKNSFLSEARNGLLQTPYFKDGLLTEEDLVSLPEPVKNYIRYTGCVGKPRVNRFKIIFHGALRNNDQSTWMPLTSVQYNFMQEPTRLFFLNAVMKKLPVAGFHCYKNRKAYMDIRLLSLFKVQFQKGPDMDQSETVTFFNDMCCMAPATLIDPRIEWLETDGLNVKAKFTNGHIAITATLYFNKTGELANFISNDRYSTDEGKKLPWSTPLHDYRLINNHLLPGYAETIYTYPDRNFIYGNFSIEEITYNFDAISKTV